MLRLLSLLSIVLLASCSGNGVPQSSVALYEDQANSKVFVYRNTGFSGSANLMEITLNGNMIGKIGNEETAIGTAKSGTNILQAKFASFGGLGLKSRFYEFAQTENENRYFLVKLNTGLLTNTVEMLEVSRGSFMNAQ